MAEEIEFDDLEELDDEELELIMDFDEEEEDDAPATPPPPPPGAPPPPPPKPKGD